MKKLLLAAALMAWCLPAYAQTVFTGGGSGGGGGTPGGAATNIQFNNGTTFAGDSGLTYAGAGGVLTLTPAANIAQPMLITGGSTTAAGTSKLGVSVVGTMNTSGSIAGAAFFANITNTASGAATTLMDIQVGGNHVMQVGTQSQVQIQLGNATYSTNTNSPPSAGIGSDGSSLYINSAGNYNFNSSGGPGSGNAAYYMAGDASRIAVINTGMFGFANNNGAQNSLDLAISRLAAGVLAVGTGAQGNVAGSVKASNYIAGGTVPVDGGGSCLASSFAGGATAGTFAAAVCAGGTIAITFAFTAPVGWSCDAEDRTTPATGKLQQTVSTTTKATFLATNSAADVIQYKCIAY